MNTTSATDAAEFGATLTAPQAELYLENLKNLAASDVGGKKWITQHEHLEKLNIQAHYNIQNESEEYVTELIVTHQKVPLLIRELLVIEIWKAKVFPFLTSETVASDGILLYMTVFHEATVVNLLEIVLYNKDAVLSAGDALIDLADYCARKVTLLSTWEETPDAPNRTAQEFMNISEDEHILSQKRDLDFRIAVTALSIYRYMTDYINELPLSAVTRILNTNDAPCSFVHLMERSPWARRTKDGKVERFQDGSWKVVEMDERDRLNKVEAQVWIGLYNLLTEPECRRKYPYDSHNITVLRRLKEYLREPMMDQLPILEGLQRALEGIAIMQTPSDPISSALSIQQLPEIMDEICRGCNWKEIAEAQMRTVFNQDGESKMEIAKSLAAMYDLTQLESLLEDPRCAKCGNLATQRCSRCKTEWYCCRQCQVKAWAGHKAICDVLCS